VVFAAEASWQGRLTTLGFEEDLVHLAPPAEDGETGDAGQFWKDFIRDTAPEFRKPTIEQLATFMQPTWQALVDGAMYCEPQLRQILDRVRPDVIVEDNVVAFPALTTHGKPFVRIMSCNPLELPGPGIPPAYSGLPTGDDTQWAAFRAEYDRTHRKTWETFNAWVQEQGAEPLPDLQFIGAGDANLYVFPAEADYVDARPMDSTWHRLDSSVRRTDESFQVPSSLQDRPADSALVYLSLGSLGGADVELMTRLVDVLRHSKHRFIVSMGPRHDEYTLPDAMWGSEFVPQTSVLPLVDLVITHGGNNTTTEALHFGKPMVMLPLFWDQYDNAQRIHELGYGKRLDTYGFADHELLDAVDAIAEDGALRGRMAEIGASVRSRKGLERGADVIERVGRA
jgi:MGT family glycosyltransferase